MIDQVFSNKYYRLMSYIIREKNTQDELDEIVKEKQTLLSQEFYNVAKEHELSSTVYVKLKKKTGIDLDGQWAIDADETRSRLQFLFSKVEELGGKLHDAGITLVLLKNGGIAIDIMDDLAECPMGDIDMFCRKEDFLEAHKIILESGFEFKFRSIYEFEDIDTAFADGSTEYSIKNGEDVAWVELAWRPVAGRWIRKDREPSADELVPNSRKARHSICHVLSNEDNLLQVSIHTAKHSYVRAPGYRLHLDVDRIVTNNDINWDLFIEKTKKVGSKTAVYFSLFFAKEILGTNIPEDVLKQLRPSKRKERQVLHRILKVGLMNPSHKKFGKIDFVLFQTALYDSYADMLAVLFPPVSDLRDKYKFKSVIKVPYYWLVYALDLIGIRKSK